MLKEAEKAILNVSPVPKRMYLTYGKTTAKGMQNRALWNVLERFEVLGRSRAPSHTSIEGRNLVKAAI